MINRERDTLMEKSPTMYKAYRGNPHIGYEVAANWA
jgi:hypothetical protein